MLEMTLFTVLGVVTTVVILVSPSAELVGLALSAMVLLPVVYMIGGEIVGEIKEKELWRIFLK